jgi:predicted DNA-binding antitoxin AbrB/MazE fold protein
MTTTIEAVYEHGILRPLTPLSLREGQRVQVQLTQEDVAEVVSPAAILAEIAALPPEGECDPSSSRDHDRILYGARNQP